MSRVPPSGLGWQTEPPVPRTSIETAFLHPEVVLLDDESGITYQLNASAAATWMLCDGATSSRAIADELGEIFDVPPDQLEADVIAAVEHFASLGLLEAGPPADFVDRTTETYVLGRPPDP